MSSDQLVASLPCRLKSLDKYQLKPMASVLLCTPQDILRSPGSNDSVSLLNAGREPVLAANGSIGAFSFIGYKTPGELMQLDCVHGTVCS